MCNCLLNLCRLAEEATHEVEQAYTIIIFNLEAGLVGSGTVYGVLGGKNYSHAMVCHTTVLESLKRLLLK